MGIKNEKQKTLRWLASHFEPAQAFVLGDSWYGIIHQGKGEYAVKYVKISDCDYAPDTGQWVSWPENRFETLGGAYYAILLNFQTNGGVYEKVA